MNGSWPDYIHLFFKTSQWGSSLGVKSEVWSYRTLWAGPGHPSVHTSLLKLPVTCSSWLWNHCSGPEFSFTDIAVFPGNSVVKSLPANARDMGLIPGSGRSPGIGNGSSVQFSDSVMSNSFWPHGLQHARPPCPSPSPGVYSNPCPLSQWCHPTISSSVIPFSSCPQFFPASGSFQMSQLFASGGLSIGVSPSTSVLPINTQEMTTHSHILAWEIPWTEEPGALQSTGLQRVRYDLAAK